MATILHNDKSKRIFVNEIIEFRLKFHLNLSRGPIDNKLALVQIMAWRRIGDKRLPEPTVTQFIDAYIYDELCVRHK